METLPLIYGTLLGDAYITKLTKTGRNRGFRYTHSTAQKDYALYKAMRLNLPFTVYQRSRFDKRTDKTYHSVEICHLANPMFNEIHSIFYPNGTKVVNTDILDKLTPEAIALWYCDDGCLYQNNKHYTNHLYISTDSFSDDERQLIIDYFADMYDLHFKSTTQGAIRVTSKKQVQRFMDCFADYIPDCMSYKREGY